MIVVHPSRCTLLVAVLATAACTTPSASAQQPSPVSQPAASMPPQIVTTGQGETKVSPDRARIEISVQTRAATAAAAGAENAQKLQAVLAALRKLGFGSDQLGTSGYNLYPEMRYEREGQVAKVIGYSATNSVRVEVRDLTLVGRAIDASLGAGANMISSLVFYSSNTDEARRTALASAVARARADADVVAQAAGGTIGDLLEITVMGSEPPVMFNKMMALQRGAGDASTPIDPAEQTVSAMVTSRWRFNRR